MFKSYNELIKFVKSQNREKGKNVYFEEHHILPRFMGGTNDKSNLILLTLYEHVQAHYLLAIENENDSKIYNGNINSAWMVSHGKSKFSENKRKEIEQLLDNPELIKIIEDLKIRLKNIKHPERKGFDPFYKHKRIWVYYKNQKPVLILEENKNGKTYSKYQIMERCPICKNPNSEKSFACCEEHKTLYLQQTKEKNSIRQKEVCKKYDLAEKMKNANKKRIYSKDKTWVKKDNESKVINKNELNDYLSKGWEKGRIVEGHPATENQKLKLSERRKNTCYIYNDEVPAKEIKLEELEFYLSQGWKKGRKPNSVKIAHGYKQPKMAWVHKDNEFKRIREENLESYLKEGWLRGRGI